MYQIRAEMGEKTVKDFAGYYLYYYKEKALERFEEECYGLEEEFFNKIVQMIKG